MFFQKHFLILHHIIVVISNTKIQITDYKYFLFNLSATFADANFYLIMNNLKNLVAKANSGLSLRSETKQKFGLGSFIAASVSEMLTTRGGGQNCSKCSKYVSFAPSSASASGTVGGWLGKAWAVITGIDWICGGCIREAIKYAWNNGYFGYSTYSHMGNYYRNRR